MAHTTFARQPLGIPAPIPKVSVMYLTPWQEKQRKLVRIMYVVSLVKPRPRSAHPSNKNSVGWIPDDGEYLCPICDSTLSWDGNDYVQIPSCQSCPWVPIVAALNAPQVEIELPKSFSMTLRERERKDDAMQRRIAWERRRN